MFKKPGLTVPYPSGENPAEILRWQQQAYDYLANLDKWAKTVQDQLNRFAEQAALTDKNTDTANSGDATTDDIIDNNRDRIAEIEAALQAVDLLA